jgi:UTP--glucose-1-phosphate uridylyltransferase
MSKELAYKVVIPAAGRGTRMLPATKEQPKEMLPIFSRTTSGGVCVKPLLHLVFEQLYDFGFRKFCFIVGRGKRAIEDHFTPDVGNIGYLRTNGKDETALELEGFYSKVLSSTIAWINQAVPRGFGDAVLQSKGFAESSNLFVHAGDTYISSSGTHLASLISAFNRFHADAAFIVKKVPNPTELGVIRFEPLCGNVVRVIDAVEKPRQPPTDYAIMPVYVFTPEIFDFLEQVEPDARGEVQLTDGIRGLIGAGRKVIASSLTDDEYWLDIGTPQNYWEALRTSYQVYDAMRKPAVNSRTS